MMISLAFALMLLASQTTAPPAASAPAPAVAPAKPPVSPRLEGMLQAIKGQPRAIVTSKLGPPESVRTGLDGEVLFWTVTVPGSTVCGADATGQLACGRQGGGSCALAMAFKTEGGLSAWKVEGLPQACEVAADQFNRETVAAPDTSKPKPSPSLLPVDE